MRTRLTLWFVLGVALFSAAGVLASYSILDRQLRGAVDAEMRDLLAHYAQAVEMVGDEQQLLLATRVYLEGPGAIHLRRRGVVLALRTADGRVLSNSADLRLEELAEVQGTAESADSLMVTARTPQGDVRLAGTAIIAGSEFLGRVLMGANLGEVEGTLDQVLVLLIAGAAVATAAAGVGSWFLIGRALGQVRRITRTAASISREDLARRIAYQGPKDEIGELAATMDAMLDRLQEAFTAQDRFISDISHELRTPLTIVRGHLQVLDRDSSLDQNAVRESHALVIEELDRMNRLVGELLLLARANRTDLLRRESIPVDTFLRTLAQQGPHLGQRDWRVEALPGGHVEADQDRLTQIFLNLMHNAAAHTREGERISLGGERAAGFVRLWVRDEGEGMARDVREQVFERFYRGPEAAGAAGGLGLGLAIVRALVMAHEGAVDVESEPGSGSRFLISLPA